MISVRCSLLEQVKANPITYGHLLAVNEGANGAGTHGMFAYLQDIAKQVHLGEIKTSHAVNELFKKFARFEDNRKNRQRQEYLAEALVAYFKLYEKMGFNFVDGWRQIRLQMTPETRLTGRTPWVVVNDNGFYSFMFSENDFDWQSQLRFPIYQHYIANKTMECSTEQVRVGIYSLESQKFQFRNYSNSNITESMAEVTELLINVYSAYSERKK